MGPQILQRGNRTVRIPRRQVCEDHDKSLDSISIPHKDDRLISIRKEHILFGVLSPVHVLDLLQNK